MEQREGQTAEYLSLMKALEENICQILRDTDAVVLTQAYDTEKIFVRCLPTKIMEDYQLLCAQEWHYAKDVLGQYKESLGNGFWECEMKLCIFLCESMIVSILSVF